MFVEIVSKFTGESEAERILDRRRIQWQEGEERRGGDTRVDLFCVQVRLMIDRVNVIALWSRYVSGFF